MPITLPEPKALGCSTHGLNLHARIWQVAWLCVTCNSCIFPSFPDFVLKVSLCCLMNVLFLRLTAVMEGFLPSPAGGCVTSAPRKITGCWNTADLRGWREEEMQITLAHKGSPGLLLRSIIITGWNAATGQYTVCNPAGLKASQFLSIMCGLLQ